MPNKAPAAPNPLPVRQKKILRIEDPITHEVLDLAGIREEAKKAMEAKGAAAVAPEAPQKAAVVTPEAPKEAPIPTKEVKAAVATEKVRILLFLWLLELARTLLMS
jgi:hypothetical protein